MANSFNSIPQTTSLFTNLYQQATQQVNPFGGYTNPPVTQSMTPSIPPPVQSVNPPFAPIPKESQKKYTVPQPKYIKTNGNNEQVVNDFINTYFKYLQENLQVLIDQKTIREYTVLRYCNKDYQRNELLQLLDQLKNHSYTVKKSDYVNSGSRRIDINLLGMIDNKYPFAQSFILCHENNSWYIKNSILIHA